VNTQDKSPLKKILKTSLPAVIDLSSQTFAWLIEAILIGNISAAALAGVGLALQIIILTFTVILTFVVGASIIINQYLGAKDHWNANHVFGQAMMIGTVLAVGITLLWYFGGTQVFLAIREEEPSARIYGVQYLKTISYFGPLLILNFMALGILRMVGETIVTMKINLFTNVLHLTIASILIFGLFGAPRLEAMGAALGVGIAHSTAFFITFYMLRSRKINIFLSFREFTSPNMDTFKRLFKLGLPATVEQLVWAFGQLVLSFYAGLLGIVVLAAHQVFVRVQSVLSMVFQGFGLASMSLVGRSIGAGDDRAAIKAGWQTGWLALGTAVLIAIGLVLTQHWWFPIFTQNDDVIRFGTGAVIVLAIIQLPKAMNMVFSSNLRGGGDLNWLMFLAISTVTFYEILGAYTLSFVFNMSLAGLWLVQGLDETTRLFLNFWRFHQRKWKIKDILSL
jgi:putative MATE family efflux protein